MSNSDTIREQNDRMRKGDASIPGKLIFTSGLLKLLEDNNKQPADLIASVQSYDNFTEDSDPYGEHDFGILEFYNEKLFWKIDYYDQGIQHGSCDPSDLKKTVRVLTVFLASEY